MKKIVLLLICISLTLSMASCEFIDKPDADGADVPTTGDSNVKDNLDDDEATTAEPTEGIKYRVSSNREFAVAVGYEGTDTDIHFHRTYEGVPVTQIDYDAFYENTNITSVTIHNGIQRIGAQSFYKCSSLSKLIFEKNATLITIEKHAFFETAIENVSIPESVKRIGKAAFGGCSKLSSIIVPSTAIIGSGAFFNTDYYCNEANWKNGVLYLGTHLVEVKMEYKGKVIIKEGTTTIAGGAFGHCKDVSGVLMPDSVFAIGEQAFYNCGHLDEFTLSKNITYIGVSAFYSCGISNDFIIPKTVKNIESSAFRYTSLYRVLYEGTKEDWNNISIGNLNSGLEFSERIEAFYYYSETAPTEEGNYWHYGENGEILIWR